MGCILGKHQRSKSSPTPVTAVAVAAMSNSNNLGRTLEKPALAVATARRSSASSQDVSNGGVVVAAATNNNGRAAVAATDGNDERRDAEASTGRAGGDGGEQRERRRSGRDRERQSHATSNANNDRHDAGIGNFARPVREKTGWPKWLTDVAGDAIKGLVPRRADTYQKLEKIGQGTYSNVYKARDLHSGKVVALKKVRFDNMEPESVKFMAREILVLRKLNHPNIIKFEGLVTSRMACSLYLVFEYMEHDLAGLAASPGIEFTESQVKCYMHQLLSGIEHCHTNGVLHRDIKGSNLLLDNEGILKIADFGLAAFFDPRNKQPMTSRVVTLWYRPPELLLGATEYGVGVDLWSAGCILAELLAGKPIMPGRTEVEQLHKIFKLCGSPTDEYWKRTKLPHATLFKPQQPYKRCIKETFKDFPPSALSLIETLLAIDPDERGTATAALHSEFFTTEPFACDPSSLPQYPPSKEMDAKLRDEEARRQRAGDAKTHANEARKTRNREQRGGRAVPAPEANAEVQANIQRRRMISQTNAKSKSEKFPPPHQDGAVGFPMAPSRHEHPLMEPQSCSYLMAPITSYSGPLGNPATVGPSRRKKRNSAEVRVAPSRVNRPSVAMSLADPRRKGKEAIAVDV